MTEIRTTAQRPGPPFVDFKSKQKYAVQIFVHKCSHLNNITHIRVMFIILDLFHVSVVSIGIFLSLLLLSICDVIVSQKGSNGE